MDEIVMRLARALASFERLQILSRLAAAGERSPTRLGRELQMSLNSLSGHLAKLATAGLMKRRRSGRWSYCVAESPYSPSTLSGMTVAWLRKMLSAPKRTLQDCGDEEVHRLSAEEAQTRVHKLVFEAATAFTDLRRLQILRRLGAGREATAEALSKELSMSERAARRHTNKLVRRRYLSTASPRDLRTPSATVAGRCAGLRRARRARMPRLCRRNPSLRSAGRPALYRLAPKFKTLIHAGLFEIVRSTWAQRKWRTS
jgi:DNA-binding transcriptional ArsR family regulator